ncbi:SIMPL domain-containing protein [Methylobacterium sp. NEAU K]|uniref:SIMPL domain-containing protein n=1 Tax=Methylobacterium sp. NEAU K TaxID=3064946 RepID=UPI0027328208|nr:SIMPL domain-containing protein [Methylobacterium sp. NEAU K]MDP4006014.1 SIMPL domain-containing protein [Methylobacterium sp. NEAU K]
MRAAVIGTLLLSVLAVPARADDADCKRHISVVGRAAEARAPDFAEVTVGIEARGATPPVALDAASKAVAGVSAQAQALGVQPTDIGTAAVTLQAATRSVARPGGAVTEEPDGYRAGNLVTVRLADMGRLGDLLRQALDSGANRIDGVSFGLRDPDAVESALQVAAARDARARAEALAGALGAKLGPICTLSTTVGTPYRPMADLARAAPMATKGRRVPIEAGTIQMSSEVSAAFAVAQ